MSASTTDFITGLDPTAYTTITGAQLAALVNAAIPFTDKGLVMATSDTAGVPNIPNASTTTKWVNYLWLRISPLTSTAILYNWNPNNTSFIPYTDGSGNTVQSNWTPTSVSSIQPGSITGSLIAANTINPANINMSALISALGISSSTVVLLNTQTPNAGNITGNFTAGFVINNGSVTGAMLAALTITGSNISAATVTFDKLVGDGTSGDMLKSTATANIAPVWFTPSSIVRTTQIEPGANAGKLVAVNTGGTDYVALAATSQGVGRLLQHFYSAVATSTAIGTTTADSSSLVYSTANMQAITNIAVAAPTIGAYHYLEVNGSILVTGGGYAWIYLYNNTGAAAPLAAIRMSTAGATALTYSFSIRFRTTAISAGTAVTYYAQFGGTAAAKVSNAGETTVMTVQEIV